MASKGKLTSFFSCVLLTVVTGFAPTPFAATKQHHLSQLKQSRLVAIKRCATDDEFLIDDNFVSDPKRERRSNQWIVLVDDEEDTRVAVGQFLFEEGFEVTACADADSLLEVCTNESDRIPSAIVSDVRMPGKDGIALLNELQNEPRLMRVPVILLTAKALTQDRIIGYSAGADAYLPKPFDPAELVAIIDNRIARREEQFPQQDADSELASLQRGIEDIKELMMMKQSNLIQKTEVFLTTPEREVLALISDGLSNREIAEERGTTVSQVSRTISKLYTKTDTETRTELVRWGMKTGYIPSV